LEPFLGRFEVTRLSLRRFFDPEKSLFTCRREHSKIAMCHQAANNDEDRIAAFIAALLSPENGALGIEQEPMSRWLPKDSMAMDAMGYGEDWRRAERNAFLLSDLVI